MDIFDTVNATALLLSLYAGVGAGIAYAIFKKVLELVDLTTTVADERERLHRLAVLTILAVFVWPAYLVIGAIAWFDGGRRWLMRALDGDAG